MTARRSHDATSDLAVVERNLTEARGTLTGIASMITGTSDPLTVKHAHERIRLAREWARIHGIAQDMHLDLLRLETSCLRRIFELGAVEILPPHSRTAAEYFGKLSQDELGDVLRQFGGCSTAIGVYRMVSRAAADEQSRHVGQRFARGDEASGVIDDDRLQEAIEHHALDFRGALATIVEECATRSFTIEQIADDVIEACGGLPSRVRQDQAIQEGIREVCRAAIRSSPQLTIGGCRAPKFVTCYDQDNTDTFVRIPFENATLAQFMQMISLREEQLRQDQEALNRLVAVKESLWIHGDFNEPMGVLAARAALTAKAAS